MYCIYRGILPNIVSICKNTRFKGQRPLKTRSSDGVITKLANSSRNIDNSLFSFVSITFQCFLALMGHHLIVPWPRSGLIAHRPDSDKLPCLDWLADHVLTYFRIAQFQDFKAHFKQFERPKFSNFENLKLHFAPSRLHANQANYTTVTTCQLLSSIPQLLTANGPVLPCLGSSW